MAEHFVAKAADMKNGERRIIVRGNHEVGVFREKDDFFAYSNICLHQGGPACEGLMIARVEEQLRDDMTSKGMRFNHDEMHFVCPWHGWEYDLKTGEVAADRRMRLRKYEVLRKGDDLYVII